MKRLKRYFEIEFSNDNTIDRGTDGHESDYSICIIGYKSPSIKEAEEFCKKDMEKMGYKYVVSVTEISKDEAHKFFDMENEDNLPILTKDITTEQENILNALYVIYEESRKLSYDEEFSVLRNIDMIANNFNLTQEFKEFLDEQEINNEN